MQIKFNGVFEVYLTKNPGLFYSPGSGKKPYNYEILIFLFGNLFLLLILAFF